MIKVPVLNPEGKEVGSVDIDPAEFGGSVNKQLLHDAVLMYQANRRAGTHKTKSRGEVAGTGKKVLRQKGSGSARAGMRARIVRNWWRRKAKHFPSGRRRRVGVTIAGGKRDCRHRTPEIVVILRLEISRI